MNKVLFLVVVGGVTTYAECAVCSKCETDSKAMPKVCSCCGGRLSAQEELDESLELLVQRLVAKYWEALVSCTNVPSVPVPNKSGIDEVVRKSVLKSHAAGFAEKKEACNELQRLLESPVAFSAMIQSSRKSTMASVGKCVVMSIEQTNNDRKVATLDSVWPRMDGELSSDKDDITSKSFRSATAYFTELIDVKNENKQDWRPYILVSDSNWFLQDGKSRWIIAKGISDKLDGSVPILVSSNVDPSSLIVEAGEHEAKSLSGDLRFSGDFAVIVNKAGESQVVERNNASLSSIYKLQTFVIPKGFSYLTP